MTPEYQICPVCYNYSPLRLTKSTTKYFQCSSCKTLFSSVLDNSGKVGGGFEEERNVEQNKTRIDRASNLLEGQKSWARILDFGCGHGMLVKDFEGAGFQSSGYDRFNEKYAKFPSGSFHLATMVEVVEHLSHPFKEIDMIYKALVPGGCLYVETSFVDVAAEENIPLEEFFYIDPSVGHSTIFSHHGIDVLMCRKGFNPLQHVNRNVRLYQKP